MNHMYNHIDINESFKKNDAKINKSCKNHENEQTVWKKKSIMWKESQVTINDVHVRFFCKGSCTFFI